jgi:HD-GYP domain-containing protein (c-di-GMP phosphodiesterase class II)
MFDRITLRRDLLDCNGHVMARRGFVVSPESIAEAAATARPGPPVALAGTFVADDLDIPLGEHAHRHLFRNQETRAAVGKVLLSIRLPSSIWDELAALKVVDPGRYRHALATSAVTARLLAVAAGESRVLPEVTAAALLHDIGMRHLIPRVVRAEQPLAADDAQEVAQHPFLGAWHLARLLGAHPAVEASLSHHWCKGQGYPDLARAPSRAIEVVTVASAYAALTQARSYRSDPYDARGAVDVLVAEAGSGRYDPSTVKLLVHALRGARGEAREVRFGRARHVAVAVVNHHTPITAPARTWL